MASKVYDVVAVTGEYQDSQGQTKKRYMNCGVVLQTDKGFSLKLEAVPVGSDGWFMLFEPKDNTQGQASQPPQQPAPQQNQGFQGQGGGFNNGPGF